MRRQSPSAALMLGCVLAATAGAQTPSQPAIPLCPGLTIVTAVHQQYGDYESIKTVEAIEGKEVRLKYSSESMSQDPFAAEPPKVKRLVMHRNVLTDDLSAAHAYQQVYLEKSVETIPGTTAIGASRAILRDLKAGKEVEMKISTAYSGLKLTTDANKRPNYYDYLQATKLRRVSSVRVPVLVNERLVELRAIRAQGDSVDSKVEFDFLDDERDPIALAFRLGIGGIHPLTAEETKRCSDWHQHPERPMPQLNLLSVHGGRCDMPNGGDLDTLRVIKITTACTGPAALLPGAPGGGGQVPQGAEGAAGGSSGAKALEQALARDRKVDIYSIYFSFNSDVIRDESQPTLKDIAEVLRRHPEWKLQVNGHTDSIGGDQSNLELSRRRAVAVKNALVTQQRIGPDRLATAGYGKSQPKDTNVTLQGRAHNRRVELIRIGG